jgi:hypothetical protein
MYNCITFHKSNKDTLSSAARSGPLGRDPYPFSETNLKKEKKKKE